jgi:hypothetical protein
MNCQICDRNIVLEKHHLVPGNRKNSSFIFVCEQCGDQLHLMFDNKILKNKLNTLETTIENAKQLPYEKEGYVVIDKNWNRVKIKSPSYVAVHHLKNNGVTSGKRLLLVIMKGEKEEFLNYFPEYTEEFEKLEKKYNFYYSQLEKNVIDFKSKNFNDRKEFALWAKNQINPQLLFMLKDKKVSSITDYLEKIGPERLYNFIIY